ncbi:hypothetical protein AGMMS49546_09070 [Spirochaetia bacterium]|nr:hypothetical protein AGMMS49546_09070 [Spirochaetia bacterium]
MKNILMLLTVITGMFLAGSLISHLGLIIRNGPEFSPVIWSLATAVILALQVIQVILLYRFREPRKGDRAADRA